MGLFDKIINRNKGDDGTASSPAMDFPLSGPAEDSGPRVAPPSNSRGAGSDVEKSEEEQRLDLLDHYLDQGGVEQQDKVGRLDVGQGDAGQQGVGQGGAGHQDLLGSLVAENEDEPTSGDNAGKGLGDDLMDIFTSDEEEDLDLSALTTGLEDVDSEELLAMAVEISNDLREFVGAY